MHSFLKLKNPVPCGRGFVVRGSCASDPKQVRLPPEPYSPSFVKLSEAELMQ